MRQRKYPLTPAESAVQFNSIRDAVRAYVAEHIRDQRALGTPSLDVREKNALIRAYVRRACRNLSDYL